MPRIPYVAADIAEPKEIVEAVRKRRGGELLLLDRMLLHSPPLAAGWNAYLGAVRTQLSIPAKARELAICGVAAWNGAEFEFVHHVPHLLQAGGTQAQADALRDLASAASNASLFDEADRAVLQVTLEMTRDVKVGDATFARVSKALGAKQQVVELVATIAAYNMVSRFLVALDVQP
ncbi:MAG: carboxymuconolactone decarboxylase family protein [Usitatibacter sp.]